MIGRTGAEVEFQYLMRRTNSLKKTLMPRKIEEKGVKDEIVGWCHRLKGHEFVQTQADIEGQRILVCCSSWGHKDSETNEGLDNNNT